MESKHSKPSISVVTTLYCSAHYVYEFYARITQTLREITDNYNIVMVNDGSPDESLNIALKLQQTDKHITVIDLSRNFGHYNAIRVGLENATGDYVFLIDSDLEEDPELLKVFWQELLKEQDCDLICGTPKVRKGNSIERFFGYLFYKVMNLITNVPIPKNVSLVRLMTKRYLKCFLLYSEKDIAFSGLSVLTGFTQKYMEINKIHKGTSTYTFSRKMKLVSNYITSLSSFPLIIIFYTGSVITIFSFFYLMWIIIKNILFDTLVGFTPMIASIWMTCGMVIFFMGVIGIYLSKILIEVKNRPNAIIKKIYIADSVELLKVSSQNVVTNKEGPSQENIEAQSF